MRKTSETTSGTKRTRATLSDGMHQDVKAPLLTLTCPFFPLRDGLDIAVACAGLSAWSSSSSSWPVLSKSEL